MVNFCEAILVLEDRRKYAIFLAYYALLFQNATETHKKNCAAYGEGEGAVTDRTCRKWFAKFCARDFLLDSAPWSGRTVEVDNDQIKTLIENVIPHGRWPIYSKYPNQ